MKHKFGANLYQFSFYFNQNMTSGKQTHKNPLRVFHSITWTLNRNILKYHQEAHFVSIALYIRYMKVFIFSPCIPIDCWLYTPESTKYYQVRTSKKWFMYFALMWVWLLAAHFDSDNMHFIEHLGQMEITEVREKFILLEKLHEKLLFILDISKTDSDTSCIVSVKQLYNIWYI